MKFAQFVATVTLALTSGCGPPPIGSERASQYFAENRAAFERVVAMADACRPASGRLRPDDDFRCTASAGNAQTLKDAMASADALWIRVTYEPGEQGIDTIQIVVRATGSSIAGEIEEFIYYAEPSMNAEYERTDDGIAVTERHPVTAPPHHWFWRGIDR